ncbi:MAG TPA: NTP transferase domain-containing protein, partial [Peptostreptococcaceae bacterium]|nr:NTP transferase domain-containing protein [Peptostreptococcaceae bacterium]
MELFKSAVILAGGKSTRMKFDKQLLCVDEKRIIYNIADKLKNEFEDIIIVSNNQEYYKDSNYKVVSDELKQCGPLGGIHIG